MLDIFVYTFTIKSIDKNKASGHTLALRSFQSRSFK